MHPFVGRLWRERDLTSNLWFTNWIMYLIYTYVWHFISVDSILPINRWIWAGAYGEEDTPVPIPNTEVKLLCGDDTLLGESSAVPDYHEAHLKYDGLFVCRSSFPFKQAAGGTLFTSQTFFYKMIYNCISFTPIRYRNPKRYISQ